jgi:hypothetical protein
MNVKGEHEDGNASWQSSRSASLTPQGRRLLEGPVLATLLRLAAPTVALMLLEGVVDAGEAVFVGRLGSDALAGVSLSFPLVMLRTTLSAGAYGGGVASGAGCRAGRACHTSCGDRSRYVRHPWAGLDSGHASLRPRVLRPNW